MVFVLLILTGMLTSCLSLSTIRFTGNSEKLKEYLMHEESWVREEAVYTIANRQLGILSADVSNLLHDPQWWVRSAAATALGQLKAITYASALEDLAFHDTHEQVRARAAESLGMLRCSFCRDTLVEVMEVDVSYYVRFSAQAAIARIDENKNLE